MSNAALSAKIFAVYVFVVSIVLIVAPNFLLAVFHMPPTSEVWIRVAGVPVFSIAVYVWVAAKHEHTPFFVASVYTRCFVFIAFTTFAVLGLASPMLVLFGVTDLLGAVWMHFALKADARAEPHPASMLAARTPI